MVSMGRMVDMLVATTAGCSPGAPEVLLIKIPGVRCARSRSYWEHEVSSCKRARSVVDDSDEIIASSHSGGTCS